MSERSAADAKRTSIKLALVGIALVAATIAGPSLHLRLGGLMLLAVVVICGAGAFFAAQVGDRADQKSALMIIVGAALAMRLGLLFTEPYLSTDMYRYIWDGRVQASGINPYRFVPGAPQLLALRDAAIFPNINRADYAVTIYPPVAQAAFLLITRIGESVTAMKLGLLAFEGLGVAAIMALLKRQGLPATRVAAYAWHPLPVWEIAGSGHVDAVMVAFLMVGLLVFLSGRTLLAGLLVTLGALVKPTALLALPVFWRPWDWRLPLVVAGTVVAAYLPYLSVGTGVFGFLTGYVEEEGLRSGKGFTVLWLLQELVALPPLATLIYVAVAAIVLAALALAIGFRQNRSEPTSITCLSWLLVAFLFFASPHYPWYFLVLVPFLAFHPTATAWTMTLGSFLLYDIIGNDGLPSYTIRISIFTLATLAAIAHDLRGQRAASNTTVVRETS